MVQLSQGQVTEIGRLSMRDYQADYLYCQIRGGAVKLQWLRDQFTVVPPYLEDMEVEQYARAYMFHMFDTRLFLDTNTNKVHLRWLPLLEDLDVCSYISQGNAVISYLYRDCLQANPQSNKLCNWIIGTLMDAGNEYFLMQYKYWCYFLCMLTKWCAKSRMLT